MELKPLWELILKPRCHSFPLHSRHDLFVVVGDAVGEARKIIGKSFEGRINADLVVLFDDKGVVA